MGEQVVAGGIKYGTGTVPFNHRYGTQSFYHARTYLHVAGLNKYER